MNECPVTFCYVNVQLLINCPAFTNTELHKRFNYMTTASNSIYYICVIDIR